MKNLIFILALLLIFFSGAFSQTDLTPDTKFNLSSQRVVSGSESNYSSFQGPSKVPQHITDAYSLAGDRGDENMKMYYGNETEKYLGKPVFSGDANDSWIEKNAGAPFNPDWYSSDVQVTNSDIAYQGGYRQLDLKQGEDGWMYLAVNRRNVGSYNGCITVFKSGNGGAAWVPVSNIVSQNSYYGSISMLVESKNNLIGDSTRIIVYFTWSANINMNDASVSLGTFRRDGSAGQVIGVGSPSAGNKFAYPSACSDGMYFQSATYMHVVISEENNSGTQHIKLHHFRSVNWGATHSSETIMTSHYELYPAAAFSVEQGGDSIYVAVQRAVTVTEHEIRLITLTDIPSNYFSVRYITDAPNGTYYKRPSITIQQRNMNMPQQILVTSTKNDWAAYHYSTNGGNTWNVDFGLGPFSQAVDYTSSNSDTLTAGNGYFIAAYVNLGGDSITVRRGVLGSMGTPQYKRNGNNGTGLLVPACAIYREGNTKYSAFAYAGFGPASVYYNMENLITGVSHISKKTPNGFALSQNYPNPFNPITNIQFAVPNASFIKLLIYDVTGKVVETLINENLKAGTYKVDWDASNFPSGVYFYKIRADGFVETKKMMLVK